MKNFIEGLCAALMLMLLLVLPTLAVSLFRIAAALETIARHQ
jgi:hypothetical protein